VKLAAFIVVCGLGACAPRTPPMATANDALRVHVELAQLQQGRTLLVQKCGNSCHVTPLPSQHAAIEWPHALDEMAARSGLDREQRALIEQYLVTMAPR
jgi:hypothetical protein